MREESADFPTSLLATRCPDCATVFRVVPDQLRLSEGWVRCGHCASIFDASGNLVDLDQLPNARSAGAVPLPAFLQDSDDGKTAAHFSELRQGDQSPDEVQSSSGLDQLAKAATPYRGRSVAARQILHGESIVEPVLVEHAAGPGESLVDDPDLTLPVKERQLGAESGIRPLLLTGEAQPPVSAAQDESADSPYANPLRTDDSFVREVDEAHTTSWLAAEARRSVAAETELDRAAEDTQTPALAEDPGFKAADTFKADLLLATHPGAADALLSDVGFVRQADHRAFTEQPRAVAMLVLGCCLLAVVLAVQFGTQQRDRVIAAIPSAKAPLTAICRRLPCASTPPHQIESVLIESSAFNRRDDHYLFSVDLRNSANLSLAMPALELTLTDLQDRIVVRRVLLPGDLDAPTELPPHALWSGRFAIRVEDGSGGSNSAPVAGYRLLVFYP
jgi:predicted Zn finger-like uncharacterized protein